MIEKIRAEIGNLTIAQDTLRGRLMFQETVTVECRERPTDLEG